MARAKRPENPEKPSHPTVPELLGLCGAASIVIEWSELAGSPVAAEVEVLRATRAFATGGTSSLELHAKGLPMGASALALYQPGTPEAHPVVVAHQELRELLRYLLGFAMAFSTKVDDAKWRTWRHAFLARCANIGTLLRVQGADHAVQTEASSTEAAAAAVASERRPSDAGSVEALALAEVLTLLRERQKLSREDVAVRMKEQSLAILTAGQLARIEGGTAGATAPIDDVARVLGASRAEVEGLAAQTLALARQLAKLATGQAKESWYGDAVASFGARFARSLLCVAAASALNPASRATERPPSGPSS